MPSMSARWEFQKLSRKMAVTTDLFENVHSRAGFTEEQRLMREAVQNSTDAHVDEQDPVEVHFYKYALTGTEKREFVQAFSLDDSIVPRQTELGLHQASALETINDDDTALSLLAIRDWNTCGLGGKWDGVSRLDNFGRLVVQLGIGDKASGAIETGGSFGFGKTAYAKSSGLRLVCFYSVFPPDSRSSGHGARFMATGLFKRHTINEVDYNGFAFFGNPAPGVDEEVEPAVDSDAHELARLCGLRPRSEKEYGTDVIIVDCDADLAELKSAAELFWWPKILDQDVDIAIDSGGSKTFPTPRKNPQIRRFIDCRNRLRSDLSEPPEIEVKPLNAYQSWSLGKRCFARCPEEDNEYSNHVALIRSPGMIVNYVKMGSDRYEPCIGVFEAHNDIDFILTLSEDPAHKEWDQHSDRLQHVEAPAQAQEIIGALWSRLGKQFLDFQKSQEPPLPNQGKRPDHLANIIGRFLQTPGDRPPPPPPGEQRQVSLQIEESREEIDGELYDVARISVSPNENTPDEPLTATVAVEQHYLGDHSGHIVRKGIVSLVREADGSMTKAKRAENPVVVSKAGGESLTATAPVHGDVLTAIRVEVSGGPGE